LSRAISRLERRIGVRLFDRTSRCVSLTAAGQAFLDASQNVLAAADSAVRTAQRAARSRRLVVAARPGHGSGLLAAVLPRYDLSKDALPVESLFTRQQAAAVRDGTADAGLMCSTEDLTGMRTAEGPEVAAVPVTDVPASLLVLGWMPAIPPPALAAFISQAKHVTASLAGHPNAS